jgi:hypothetical protein
MDFDWNNVGIGNLCAFWLSFALYRMQWVVWIGRLGEKWWDYEKMPKWGMSLFSCASSFLLYIVVFPSSSILCIPLNLVEKNECDWWILLLEVLYSKLLVLFFVLHTHYTFQRMAIAQNPWKNITDKLKGIALHFLTKWFIREGIFVLLFWHKHGPALNLDIS